MLRIQRQRNPRLGHYTDKQWEYLGYFYQLKGHTLERHLGFYASSVAQCYVFPPRLTRCWFWFWCCCSSVLVLLSSSLRTSWIFPSLRAGRPLVSSPRPRWFLVSSPDHGGSG
ncbi:hypothetical protein FQN60_016853, partial [Etheostoma spectabile]